MFCTPRNFYCSQIEHFVARYLRARDFRKSRAVREAEPLLHAAAATMFNLWIIAAGAAVAAAAYVARRGRRRSAASVSPRSDIQPVSNEWLSHARGRGDENW